MSQLRNTVIRAGLEALYFSGAHYLLRPIFSGVGAIFMLHHVRPRRAGAFQPNHHLEIEPTEQRWSAPRGAGSQRKSASKYRVQTHWKKGSMHCVPVRVSTGLEREILLSSP